MGEFVKIGESKKKKSFTTMDPSLVQHTPRDIIGKFGRGNINLYNRPKVSNGGDSYSTLDSFSMFDARKQKEVLVPSVIPKNGKWKHASRKEAWEHYLKTGEHLGEFDTPEDADEYAVKLHEQQARIYDRPAMKDKVIPLSEQADYTPFEGVDAVTSAAPKGEKFSPGKLLGGMVLKGGQQVAQTGGATAAFLERHTVGALMDILTGDPHMHETLPFHKWNEGIKEEGQQLQQKFAGNVAAGGRAAELADQWGTATVAAVPQAVGALATAGTSMTTKGLEVTSQLAQKAPKILTTLKSAVGEAGRDPQYWLSFFSTVGTDYEQAKADGASDWKAALYALGTSALNAKVEIGGGMQTALDKPKNQGWVRTLVDSALEEAEEEPTQGMISQLMENIVYGQGNPLFSTTDEDAVFNPKRAAGEAIGGAVVGGVLTGAQLGISAATGKAQESHFEKQLGRAVDQSADRESTISTQGEIEKGHLAPKGSKAHQLANLVEAQRKGGGKADAKTLGKLTRANAEAEVELLTRAARQESNPVVSNILYEAATERYHGGITAKTLAKLNAAVTAAEQNAPAAETQAAVTKAENPGKKVISGAATMIMERQGLSAKKAEKRATIMQRLMDGDTSVTRADINAMEGDRKTTQAIFSELTGVQFPAGPIAPEQLLQLYKSAPQVMAQAQAAEEAAHVMEEAAPAMEETAPVMEQTAPVMEQAAPVMEQTAPVQERASAIVDNEGPDGKPLATFSEFSRRYRTRNPQATREELARQYSSYLHEATDRTRFYKEMRQGPDGDKLTQDELRELYDNQRGESRYSVSDEDIKTYREAVEDAETVRRHEIEAEAKHLQEVLRKAGIKGLEIEVVYDEKMGAAGEDLGDGKHIRLNGARLSTANMVRWTLGHELTHTGTDRTSAGSEVRDTALADRIIKTFETLNKAGVLDKTHSKWMSDVDARIAELKEKYEDYYKDNGEKDREATVPEMREELAGDLMGYAFGHTDILNHLAGEDRGLVARALNLVNRLLDKTSHGNQVYTELRAMQEDFQKALEKTMPQDGESAAATAEGAPTGDVSKTTGMGSDKTFYSYSTYLDPNYKQKMDLSDKANHTLILDSHKKPIMVSGREVLEQLMKEHHASADARKNVLEFMDNMAKFMKKAEVDYQYIGLEDVNNARIKIRRDGKGKVESVVLSAMVKNGEYPVNFDFTKICKRREAMSKFLDALIEEHGTDELNLSAHKLLEISKILKDAGYDTACLGCFVEAKRYNVEEWAKSFVSKWNRIASQNGATEFFNFTDKETNILNKVDAEAIDKALRDYQATNKEKGADKKQKSKEEAAWVQKFNQNAKDELLARIYNNRDEFPEKSDKRVSDKKLHEIENHPVGEPLTDKTIKYFKDKHVLSGQNLNNAEKIENMIKSSDVFNKKLRLADLITPEGITNLMTLSKEFAGLVSGHYGSATPKFAQGFVPYNNEIAYLQDKVGGKPLQDYLINIAGLRSQSFSDFKIENVFDYLQMIAELTARKLPAHMYTKEIACARLLGKCGIKVNISIMFDVMDANYWGSEELAKENAGLWRGENGELEYCIGDQERSDKVFAETGERPFIQSAPFKEAVTLQETDGYTKNTGIIAVGYGFKHIWMMLDDYRIRYIIPYHTSNLPVEIKGMTNLQYAQDFTEWQNTTKIEAVKDAHGKDVKFNWKDFDSFHELMDWAKENNYTFKTKEVLLGHGDFPLYERLNEVGDPRKVAQEYVDWCFSKQLMPVFYHFAEHNNYYKLVYDFNVYDNVTEEPAPQVPVQMWNEKGEIVGFDSNFREQVEAEMKVQNSRNKVLYGPGTETDAPKFQPTLEEIYRRVKRRAALPDTDSDGNSLSQQQMEYFKDSKVVDENGNLMVMYHGAPTANFTVFDPQKSADKRSLFFTSDPKVANSYAGSQYTHQVNPDNLTDNDGRYRVYLDMKNPLVINTKKTISKKNVEVDVYQHHSKADGWFLNHHKPGGTEELGGMRFTSKGSLIDFLYRSLPRQAAAEIEETLETEDRIFGVPADRIQYESPGSWASVKLPNGKRGTTRRVAEYAQQNGYDGVLLQNVIDYSIMDFDLPMEGTTVAIAFNPEQVKDADNKNPTKNKDIRYALPDTDSDYMAAVNRGDMETAQQMVDAAAERAGYLVEGYHGTNAEFYVFDRGDIGFHFGTEDQALDRGRFKVDQKNPGKPWRVTHDYLKIKNPLKVDTDLGSWNTHNLIDYLLEEHSDGYFDDIFSGEKYQIGPNKWVDEVGYLKEMKLLGQGGLNDHYKSNAAYAIRDFLMKKGYDGIEYENHYEGVSDEAGDWSDEFDYSYIAFLPEQVKSADPVTYDDAGEVIPLSKRFNVENKDIRYALPEDFHSRPLLEESTVDKYLKDYASETSPKYAQAYIAYIDPYDFLDLTSSLLGQLTVMEETKEFDKDKFIEATRDQPIQLIIDHETGEVLGHEGRHRSLAVGRRGVTQVPVLLFDSSNKNSKEPIDSLRLTGQDFGHSKSNKSVNVHDLIPFNYEHRAEILEKFSQEQRRDRLAEKYGNPILRYAITPEFEQWYKENYNVKNLTDAQLKRRLETSQRRAEEAKAEAKAAKKQVKTEKRNAKKAVEAERKYQEQLTEDRLNYQRLLDDHGWSIFHTAEMRKLRQERNDKIKATKAEAAAAKAEAVQMTKDVERAKSDLRHEGDVMAEKRKAASRLHTQENAYQDRIENLHQNEKLHRNASKNALRTKERTNRKRSQIEAQQGPVDTIRKNPRERAALKAKQSAAEKLRTLGRKLYSNFVNDASAIDRFSHRQIGGTRAGTLVTVLHGSGSTVESIFKRGLVNRAGDRIGDAMSNVFLCWNDKHTQVLENMQAVLQDYLLHVHNIDRMGIEAKALYELNVFEVQNPWLRDMDSKEFALLVGMTEKEVEKSGKQEAHAKAVEYNRLLNRYNDAKNKPIFGDANGNAVTAETSREIVAEYEAENPWLKDKAQEIYDWWDAFMREWAVGDSLSLAEYESMREMYPHYVPTYRVKDAGVGGANYVGMNGASVSKATQKAIGSLSEVMPIEDSFANLVSKIVKLQRVNALYRNMIDTAMLDEDGLFGDLIAFDWDWQEGSYGKAMQLASLLSGDVDETVDQAEAAGVEKVGQDYKLTCWIDGRQYHAFISEELYQSIASTTGHLANDLEQALLRTGNKLTGPMKMAITGINPAFAARNVLRDFPTAVINSISGMAFPMYYARAAKEMATGSDHWKQFVALGGTNAGYYNNEKGFVSAMEPEGAWAKAKAGMGKFNDLTEAQTRFAEYLATIDRLGDTYENRLQGIKNAAEVTVDFSRHGRYGKVINAWVPYWNPAVQGIDKVVRSMIESPDGSAVWKQAVNTLGRAAMTSVLTEALLYALLKMKGRYEDWEELDDRTKDTYYCIPYGEEHTFIKIPKNREWGAILGTPFMRILEGYNGRENPFENYIDTSIEPNFLPPAILRPRKDGGFDSDIIGISQALDLARNKDFAERTIVPYALKEGSLSLQSDSDTSYFSKKLGELLNFSPMQADYIIKDYFGDFGKLYIMATSEAVWNGDKSLGDSVLDLLAKPWQADTRYKNQAVSKYYDTLTELKTLVQDRRNQLKDDDKVHATLEYQTQKGMEELYGKEIADLNTEIRGLPDGQERDDKKERVTELAAEALRFYEQSMSGEIKSPLLTAKYANLDGTVADELIRMDGFSEDYRFKPTGTPSKKYTDPRHKNREFVLTEEQKVYFSELYAQTYNEMALRLIESGKYRRAKDAKKASYLEDLRDDVLDETKEEFFRWLKKNGIRSTPKEK